MAILNRERIAPGGSHRTLAERAFHELHDAIVTGTIEAGQRLPVEELARTLDMSPMPIREALRRLESVGLVENIPHRGARVTELSHSDLRQVYDARLALETMAVRQAAERFSHDAASAAQHELDDYRAALRARDHARSLVAHTRFHFTIYHEAGSEWLIRLVTPLWETSERYRLTLPIEPVENRLVEHDRILQACVAHDSELAAAELHNHLCRTANGVAKHMGSQLRFELVSLPTVARHLTQSV